jgi:hypothetical protein
MALVESAPTVARQNVGRLAERIVANELEWHVFRVSDLNKDGLSPNADLIAAAHAKVWQIQVKGASNLGNALWWVQYGYCNLEIIEGRTPMFNRLDSFYKADIVVLAAIRSPREYRCIVLTAADAENAAQINLEHDYRTLTRRGEKKKPHKVWSYLEPAPREHRKPPEARNLIEREREILRRGEDAWHILK